MPVHGTGFGGTDTPFPVTTGTIDGTSVPYIALSWGPPSNPHYVDKATGFYLPIELLAGVAGGDPINVGDPTNSSIRTTIVAGASVVPLQVDDVAFTYGTSGGAPPLGVWNDAGALITASGRAGVMRIAKDRILHTYGAPRASIAQNRIELTTTTETTIISAGAAGIFHDITYIDASSTNATTPVTIDFRDTTGGSVKFSIDLVAQGGSNKPIGRNGWLQTAAATNWTAQLSAAISPGRIAIHIQAEKRVS